MASVTPKSGSVPGSGAAGAQHPKRSLLDDSDSDSDGGAQLDDAGNFKVNQEYARRFEHNKKREEKQKLEEKFKKSPRRAARDDYDSDDDETSSSNETEDEDGFLATEDLDAQISATLSAIRNKDPRVYDKSVTFVQIPDEALAAGKEKKEKPVFLRDYQREKLMRGDVGGSDDDEPPQTYAQEQDALRKSIVSEIQAARQDDGDSSDDDGFTTKKKPVEADANGIHPSRATKVKVSQLDVANAAKDPENYLSNFLASRAWIPEEGGRWKAFESDDGDDDDDMADAWEQAYNMRFEDPAKSNEVLKTYARDVTAARSVRREEKTGRKRQRELERERKEAEKRQRREEKARLRKLKLEETGDKLRMFKQAAGAVGKQLREEEWMQFLDDAWDNDKWEEEMQRRFGDDYYAMDDGAAGSDDDDDAEPRASKKKGPKKPKWDDDIDINDIVPDFDDAAAEPTVALSDDDDAQQADNNDEDAQAADDDGADQAPRPSKRRKTASDKRTRLEAQKTARRERTRLEALVDAKLELTDHDLLRRPSSSTRRASGFRYRETSPQSFGLTPRDILFAPSDQALNDFAGLKKLAPFRDDAKKRRDRKRLAKKARLRQWRRDTFGRRFEADGPTYGFDDAVAAADAAKADDAAKRPLWHAAPKGRAPADDGAAPKEPEAQGNVVGEVGGVRKKKRKRSKGKGAVAEDA